MLKELLCAKNCKGCESGDPIEQKCLSQVGCAPITLNDGLDGSDGSAGEYIVITLFGGTKLAYPASQKDDPNSDYNMLFKSFRSSYVWIDGEQRWMGDMPIERIDIAPNAKANRARP